MTAPVKNNQVPQNDPYGDYGYEDPYGSYYGDEYADGDFGLGEDEYIDGEGMGGEGPQTMTVQDARQYVTYLESLIKNSELSAEEKKELTKELKALKGKINAAAPLSGPALEQALSQINEQLFNLENKINGVDEEGGEGGSLKSQLEDTKKKIQEDPNLTEKKKTEFIEKIDKWLSTLELGASEEMESKIMDEFMTLQEEYADAALFTGAASSLGELTGMDPGEIEELAKKHGIDLKNLPNPPDANMAAFIAELPNISGLVEDVNSKFTELQSKIDSAVSSANAINEANQASGTSQKDSVDWTPFKFLYNAKFHHDDQSQALGQARIDLAKEVANVLGALYGTEVTAIEDPAKAGMISFNGTELNVLGKGGSSAKLGFSSEGPEWPSVDLVEVYVDDEGDGKTSVPSWMREAHYPYHIYDTGGACYSPSGNWSWGGDAKDIGHEV